MLEDVRGEEKRKCNTEDNKRPREKIMKSAEHSTQLQRKSNRGRDDQEVGEKQHEQAAKLKLMPTCFEMNADRDLYIHP